MKKFFPENKGTKKKFLEFVEERGFYVVLVLCILVIGATILFVTRYNIPSSNKDFNTENIVPNDLPDEFVLEDDDYSLEESLGGPATMHDEGETIETGSAEGNIADGTESTVSNEGATGETGIAKEEAGQEVKEIIAQAEKNDENLAAKTGSAETAEAGTGSSQAQAAKETSANSVPASVETSGQGNISFISPVLGEVINVFAHDTLIYSKTLNQWRAHNGIDLAADRGTPVRAAANGVVVDVKNDPRWGISVVIDHENGFKTVYSNLASDEMVVHNEKVAQGDIIGCVGNTAAFESAEQPHLHFEVWKDDKPVNPEDYINK